MQFNVIKTSISRRVSEIPALDGRNEVWNWKGNRDKIACWYGTAPKYGNEWNWMCSFATQKWLINFTSPWDISRARHTTFNAFNSLRLARAMTSTIAVNGISVSIRCFVPSRFEETGLSRFLRRTRREFSRFDQRRARMKAFACETAPLIRLIRLHYKCRLSAIYGRHQFELGSPGARVSHLIY